jgi:hypothetical protein
VSHVQVKAMVADDFDSSSQNKTLGQQGPSEADKFDKADDVAHVQEEDKDMEGEDEDDDDEDDEDDAPKSGNKVQVGQQGKQKAVTDA